MKSAATLIYAATSVAAIITAWSQAGALWAWLFGAACCAAPAFLPDEKGPRDDADGS